MLTLGISLLYRLFISRDDSSHSSLFKDYELVTRYFHDDPLRDNAALVHFLTVHSQRFAGVAEMLWKYGQRGMVSYSIWP